MNAVMKNICKEVQSVLTLRSSLLFKKKVTLNLTVSLFKKYSYTNSSQKALLIVLLENNIYNCEFFSRTNERKRILCRDEHFLLRLIFHHPALFSFYKSKHYKIHIKAAILKHDFNISFVADLITVSSLISCYILEVPVSPFLADLKKKSLNKTEASL